MCYRVILVSGMVMVMNSVCIYLVLVYIFINGRVVVSNGKVR